MTSPTAREHGDPRDDAISFEDVYARYFDMLYAYLYFLLRDRHEAEDATQEVFARVMVALPTYRSGGVPLRVWLLRIARNHGLNVIAKRNRSPIVDPAEVDDIESAMSVDDALEARLASATLLALIEGLSLRQRQVIALRFLVGFSVRDIAELLDSTPNAIRLIQQRALTALRRELGVKLEDPAAAREQVRHTTRQRPLALRRLVRPGTVTRARGLALAYRATY